MCVEYMVWRVYGQLMEKPTKVFFKRDHIFSEEFDSEILRRFCLLYGLYSKRGREADRTEGIEPSGYELEEWYINKRLED